MNICGTTKICLIIGDPIGHTLSPAMHNAAYEALGIEKDFVYLAAKTKIEDIQKAVEAARALNFRGLTCTMPHKILVLKYLDKIDSTAQKIGAVNTVVNDEGILTGYNTDWLGVVTPIKKITAIKGKQAAVIGAGGAARAMIYGLLHEGANVTIFNRTWEKAKELAKEFNCQARKLQEMAQIKNFDFILNSTALGMGKLKNQTPVPRQFLTNKQIVFEAVYEPQETRLLQEAKEAGAKTIPGWQMLLYQGTAQFELYTGHRAPEAVMEKALLVNINSKNR